MKRLILTAAIVAAVGAPSIALAQTSTDVGAMVCRAAKPLETSNALMGTTKLACRPIDMAKVQAAQKSMMGMMPKTLTDAQMKEMKADQDTFNLEFQLPVIPGGGTPPDR
jgi:hypothetical protein